jgi:hypothetical protein
MLLRFTLVLSLVVVAREASAQALSEFAGVRTMSMGGAQRAVGTNNDAIYANPGGIALDTRYDIELAYQRAHEDGVNFFNGSVVDGKTGPVAGGLAYTYTASGARDTGLHRFYIPLAMQVSSALAIGITVKHLMGHFDDLIGDKHKPALWSGDAGALAKLSDSLRIGVSGRNILRDERSALQRRDLGAGLAYTATDGSITLAGEAVWDLEDRTRSTAWRIGGEYVASATFPLRAGFQRRPFVGGDGTVGAEKVVSAGAGVTFADAGSINVGYETSLDRHNTWQLGFNAALKL